ncbi:MAG: alpha/beta fold hydrolase [Mycobacteriales bacterium]
MSGDAGRRSTPTLPGLQPDRTPGGDAERPVVVRRVRRGAGPDPLRVLLLHGLCGSAAIWDSFVPLADVGCELWTADLPWRGTGVAGWPDQPVEEWLARAVADLPGGADVLMAHSFGTNAVLRWLDRQTPAPDGRFLVGGRRLRGLVLVSPLYRADPADFGWDSIAYYVDKLDGIIADGLRAAAHRALPAEKLRAVALRVRDLVGPYGWIRFFDTYLRMPEVRGERLAMPVLVVSGELDTAAFPADAEALGAALPNAEVHILPGGRHYPMITTAETFGELANTFLGELSRTPRRRPAGSGRQMTAETEPVSTNALLAGATRVALRPRYEGSNICTWIGFKHINYLVEEAVLEHFRGAGLPAGALFEDCGLGVDIVELDTRILHALHLDDLVTAVVVPATGPDDPVLRLRVSLNVDRGGQQLKAATAKAAVSLRAASRLPSTVDPPARLARFVAPRLGAHRSADRAAGRPVEVVPPATDTAPADRTAGTGHDPVLDRLTGGRNAFGRKSRIPYPYCHFTEWLQMSGYLRRMEEVVEEFLADRAISIAELLADRRWIPVVPHSRIEILDEARMEEDLYTVYTVEDIFKDATYTSRMDCYVLRDGALLPTATGSITHGYAVIESRRDWRLVSFDDRVLRALGGNRPAGQAGDPAENGVQLP